MDTATILAHTKKLLREHDLRARKGLAQHFLIDADTVTQILAAADISTADTVIEVGPGLGVLTRELVKVAGKIVAIELDGRLVQVLRRDLAAWQNLTVIEADVLKTEPGSVLGGASEYKLVANLPYYITSSAIRHFLEASVKPRLMVVMVQKEVAEQITAQPGRMSLLSVSVQLYGAPRIVAQVPSHAFYPAPDVDSAVLRIEVYPRAKVASDHIPEFFDLVRAGFSANRKQLINSLSRGLGMTKDEVLPLLAKADIDPKRRAETLTIEEWGRLFDCYHVTGSPA